MVSGFWLLMTEAQVGEIIANDPANVLGTYEVALMMASGAD
ncbi:hypothetical protein ACQ86K_23920 [Mucilaginibacter sp. P19]